MKKWINLILLISIITATDNETVFNYYGEIQYYYITRLTDGSIINLPFRIANVTLQNAKNNFSLYSNLGLEFRMLSDTHFLQNSNPQDLIWDLRELYLNWVIPHGEIRLGKQIHAWGSVDSNSPVDNLSAYDYYYLFSTGAEQKLGTFSTAGELYFKKWKIGFSISPLHNTNRLPINDTEFPVGLPASPNPSQVIEVENPMEVGFFISNSYSKGDLTLSFFSGHDRVFSLSGANVYTDKYANSHQLDTVFSYRKTNIVGLNSVVFIDKLTLRGDFAYFKTFDPTTDISNRKYKDSIADFFGNETIFTELHESYPFKVNAEYYQMNLQVELGLPWDVNLACQYFKYDTLKYNDKPPPLIDLPDFQSDIKPVNYFFPGMGAPIAILSKNAIILNITREFINNKLELKFQSIIDLEYSGKLFEVGVSYNIIESLIGEIILNKVLGDEIQSESYPFNELEDFSHLRVEINYFF